MNKKLMQGGILIGTIISACIVAAINEHERKKENKRAQELIKQQCSDFDKQIQDCNEALNRMMAEKVHMEKVNRLNKMKREGLI